MRGRYDTQHEREREVIQLFSAYFRRLSCGAQFLCAAQKTAMKCGVF
jgi:hypothetical protein